MSSIVLEESSSRHLLDDVEDFLNRTDHRLSTRTTIRFRSQSVDHLCINRRSNNAPQVSQTTRTQFDLSQIESDDDVLPLQRSRSAPICSTKIYEEELAAFVHGEEQFFQSETEEEVKVIPMEKCVEFPERLSTIYESPSPPPSFSDDHEDKLVVYDFTRKNVDNEQKSAPSHIQTMKLIHSSSSSLSDFISPISLMKSSTFYRCSSSHCTFVRLFSVSSTSKVDTRLFIEFLFVLVVVLVVRHSSSKHSIAYSLSDRFRSGIDQEETRRHRKSSE